MNTLSILNGAYRVLRDIDTDQARAYARGTANDVLGRYGYVPQPSILSRALPIAAALGAGVAIGAGVALLLAPKKGDEVRAQIGEQATAMSEKIRSTMGWNHSSSSEDEASNNANGRAHA
ncbi:MAG: hypothetical protein SangKO_001650 [Sandaracinaceae bacterium]